MKKREKIELLIESMGFGGKSYGYHEGRKIELKGGIKGQKVNAMIKKIRKNKVEAKILDVIEQTELAKADVCDHFGICGGCMYLPIEYKDQIAIKQEGLLDLLANGEIDVETFNFEGVEGSDKYYEYRNKMEYTFGNEEKGGPTTLGMHKKGRSFDIVTVDKCMIIDEDYRTILKATLEFFKERQIPHYNKITHQGFMRFLVVRKGHKTGEIMVNLVTTSQIEMDLTEYKDMLLSLDTQAEIVSILNTIDDDIADAVKCEELRLIHGRDHIYEELLGLRFKISPFSFFQTNTLGAEKLYTMVREYVGSNENKTIFDLYCGTGTIGQMLSDGAKEVIGIELVEEAVVAANENAKLNKIDNAHFIAGDVAVKVKELKVKPDIIVVDPPRAGIHKNAIRDIIDFDSKEIVYVSCNPKTLVDDLKIFQEAGYSIEKMRGMDMFAHTPHCETIVKLIKK